MTNTQSRPLHQSVQLEAGSTYTLTALQKDALNGGPAEVSVGVTLPDQQRLWPIPGTFLPQGEIRKESDTRNLAFFLKVQGEGIWCQDGEFFAEYFDSLELSGNGNPLATQCELDIPDWHWSANSAGVPPSMLDKTRSLDPMLFSARWTARLDVVDSDMFIFLSTANQGSRIVVDGVTVLDYWEECCSTFSSEPVPLSSGYMYMYNTVAYEYRSGYTTDYSPTDSYAQLSWIVGTVSFGSAGTNSSNVTSTAAEMSATVGWLACPPGSGTIHGSHFQAGVVSGDADLATHITFASPFADPPRLFGSMTSTSDLNSHLRLSEAAAEQVCRWRLNTTRATPCL